MSGDPQTVVKRDDGSWLIDGAESFSKVADLLNQPLDENHIEFVTVAGYVLSELGRLPIPGDSVSWGPYVVEVMDMDGKRIDKVLASLLVPAAG